MKRLLEIGSKFGGYTVEKLLGKGAMGQVYLIRDGDDLYALKVMSVEGMEREKAHEWRKRFAREAEAAMKIRHDNLVKVYDVGQDPETHLCYILMEYVGGGTLSARIKANGRLEIREALSITMHVASALQAAHDLGVIHRDIKPDNIMFSSDGVPKLADLGIARVDDGDHETSVTRTDVIVGTPAYMSPEQMINSHDIDARADIYSLGMVLYEMLTGSRPRGKSTVVELLTKAINGEELPDVRKMRPEVSASLSCVISSMVSHKPEKRPASALEAAKLLKEAFTGDMVRKKRPKAGAARRAKLRAAVSASVRPLAFAAAGIAVALAVAKMLFVNPPPMRPANDATPPMKHADRPAAKTSSPEKMDSLRTVQAKEILGKTPQAAVDSGAPPVTKDDFRARVTGVAVCEASAKNYDKMEFHPPETRYMIPPGSKAVFRVEYDFPEGYSAAVWVRGGAGFYSNPSRRYPGKGVAYGYLGLYKPKGDVKLDSIEVTTNSDPGFDGCRHGWTLCSQKVALWFKAPADKSAEDKKPEGSQTAKTGSYDWRYVLDESGNATLTGDGARPCISPKPNGRVEVPAELDGHKVTAIGDKAFVNCDKMTEIALPESLERITEWRAFARCRSLKEIKLPKRLQSIGGWAFKDCSAMRSFDFGNCTNAPNGFGCLFANDRSLSNITASPDNSVLSSVDGVLYSKDRKRLLAYPKDRTSLKLVPGVEVVDVSALIGCSMRNVKIPEGVTEIRDFGLEYNDGYLETVEFPKSLKKIGYVIFKETHSIKKVTFHGDAPEHVSGSLGWNRSDFVIEVERGSKGWNGPGSTDLPERWPLNAGGDSRRIRYIGETDANASAAAKPEGSKNMTVLVPRLDRDPKAWAYSFELRNGWEKPGFDDSKWRRGQGGFGIYVPHWNRWGQINTKWSTKKLYLRKRFNWNGGNITRVVAHAFHDDGMKMYLNGKLIFSDPYCKFDWIPFEIPAQLLAKALKKGENVLAVEATNDELGGYFDCDLLVECDGETEQYEPRDGIRRIQTQDGVWTVRVLNGIAQIGDGDNAALTPRPVGDLEIPRELGGLRIRAIARRAFIDCNGLASVKIPEGVRRVGHDAFMKCRDLERVEIPESLEYIGLSAFEWTNIESIDIKNVRSIQGITFKFCPNLNEVRVNRDNPFYVSNDGVLYDKSAKAVVFCPRNRKQYKFPKGIRSIYECAFMHTKLESIVIPETVDYVGHSAFSACPNLRKVTFKGDDCRIDSWAFGHNPKLRGVVLPRKLTSLNDKSIFDGDPELEDIVIPDAVETICGAVFAHCNSLKRISLGKSLKLVGGYAFGECAALESVAFAVVPEFQGVYNLGGCPNLKTVRFLSGDAPEVAPTFYKDSNPDLVTLVRKGSRGWNGPGSTDLPERWPVGAGKDSRPIRYAAD